MLLPLLTPTVTAVEKIRTQIATQGCWYFLLAVLFMPVFIDNGKLVTNLYRVGIGIPILLCMRWPDVKVFLRQRFVQLFLAMTGWCLLTLVWSPENGKLLNMVTRMLTTLLLLYLVWLVSYYQPRRYQHFPHVYIAAALCFAVMMLWHWEGIATLDMLGLPLGVFPHHTLISWYLCAAALLTLYTAMHSDRYVLLYSVLTLFFTTVLLLVQSRTGIVALVAGLCIMLVLENNRRMGVYVVSMLSLAAVMTWLIESYQPGYLASLWHRADAGRLTIYQKAWTMIADDPRKLMFGHGIAIDSEMSFNGDYVHHMHMLYLNIWFRIGAVGLVLFLTMMGYRFCRIIVKNIPHNGWDVIVAAMLVGFLFDGNRFYHYPGSLMAAFLIPLFITQFTESNVQNR